jgi:hypothetical protein
MRLALALILCGCAWPQSWPFPGPGRAATGATPTITLSHHWIASCADATTCAVTATGGVAAGNLLVIQAMTANAVYISSISAGGAAVDANIRAGVSSRRFLSGAYVLSASAVASGATITVTFSGTTGTTGARVSIRDFAYSGGSMALDAVGDISSNSGVSSPVSGVPLTLSGTSDAVIQWAFANNGSGTANITAVSAPWADTDFSANAGFADQVGITSFAAPTWTAATPTLYSAAAMAFGFGVTPCTHNALVDFRGGTDGASVTAADLTASLLGGTANSNPIIAAGQTAYFTATNAGTTLKYSTAAHHSLYGSALRFCNGGASYTDSNNLGLVYDTTSAGTTVRNVTWTFPYVNAPGQGVASKATAQMWFYTTMSGSDTANMDIFGIFGNTGANGINFANVILNAGGGSMTIRFEGSVDANITISSSTWYRIEVQYEMGGTHRLRVYNEAGSQVGSEMTVAGSTDKYPKNVYFGDLISNAKTTGRVLYFDKIKVCYIGPCSYPMN